MIIKHFTAAGYETNNYLVICKETREAALIDAGGDFQKTMKIIEDNNANLKLILHTHGHFDHIGGDYEIQNATGAKVLIHKNDEQFAKALKQQLMMFGMKSGAEPPKIDGFLEDGQIVEFGKIKLKVIHTPGHSSGGVCFLSESDKVLFAGDTLFADSVGRTDLPGGSYETLRSSVKNKLFALDDEIIVYPGHGPSTTIGHEKENNPFFGSKARI